MQRENYSAEEALTHYVQNKSPAVAERAQHNHLRVAAAHFVPPPTQSCSLSLRSLVSDVRVSWLSVIGAFTRCGRKIFPGLAISMSQYKEQH